MSETPSIPRIYSGSVSDIPDEELLERAVKYARDRNKRRAHTRREAVQWTFGLGSTYAAELCQRFNLDPFEMVR